MKYRNHLAIFGEGLLLGIVGTICFLLLLFGLEILTYRYLTYALPSQLTALLAASIVLIMGHIIGGSGMSQFIDDRSKKALFFIGLILPIFGLNTRFLFTTLSWPLPWIAYIVSSGISTHLLTHPQSQFAIGQFFTGQRWYRILSYIALALGLAFIVANMVLSARPLNASTIFIGSILGTISMLVPFTGDEFFHPVRVYVAGGLVSIALILSLIGIIRAIKEKTVPTLKILIATLLLSSFFISTHSTQHINWHVPHVSVSEKLERSQTTVFYPLFKLMQRAHFWNHHYILFIKSSGEVIIVQHFNDAFSLNTDSLSTMTFSPTALPPEVRTMPHFQLPTTPWFTDERLKCTNTYEEMNHDPYRCTALDYKGKRIFSQENSVYIVDVKVSKDEKMLYLIEEDVVLQRHIVHAVAL